MKVLLAGVLSLFSATLAVEPKVKFDLVYESLCPDCKELITGQMGPDFQKLTKYLDIRLNPFGNARMSVDPHNPDLHVFDCQHGEDECIGSITEACFLNKLPKDVSPVPTIACIEGSNPADFNATVKVSN